MGKKLLLSLGESAGADPRLNEVSFVIRETGKGEPESIYAFWEDNPETEERLARLVSQLRRADRFAYSVSYTRAEDLAGILADKLISQFGRKELTRFSYIPIPRGGHIVLGMLSYCLDLPKSALSRKNATSPVILVDDCVISGLRAKEFSQDFDCTPLSLAVLAAPDAITDSGPHPFFPFPVICAHKLPDRAPDLYGEEYGSWVKSWEQKIPDKRLWIGQTDYLAFPWNEPESAFINSVTGKGEKGFRLAPSTQCLFNRVSLKPNGSRISIHSDKAGSVKASGDTVALDRNGAGIVIAKFSSTHEKKASCFLLENSAADMWRVLMKHVSRGDAIKELLNLYEGEPNEIAADFDSFIESLKDLGLVARD